MKSKIKAVSIKGAPRKKHPLHSISIHVPGDVLDKYDREAKRLNVTRASLVRQALIFMLPTITFQKGKSK